MSYAIVGFGKIGQALARAFARSGIEVSVATTRDPESFAADAAAIGPGIVPRTLADAVKADVIFLAVPFSLHADVAKALSTWQGKTIVDVTNAYGVPPETLRGLPPSRFVAQAFTGGKLVKGFNHLGASVLAQDPAVHGGRRVVFLASDDDGAAADIAALAERLGFAPVQLGGLAEGGLLVQGLGDRWGPLIFKDLHKFDR
ncbi:NAD(P)-binding domain-containing protein [Caballeronia sp. LZ034LL]|uniref:NADPH-dependent F420 reductase n=1 Tax=Caballeronia sp. LZ034LL TaxID=3038567 RepID=UPI0028627627|nr:NAD(P)-binding domain-containing protein [Caballeronia sp. LZ034LL]MDR5836093.1 NAD(P)-binding domain-containing protein [Caballeronia sp. LZ034LL]